MENELPLAEKINREFERLIETIKDEDIKQRLTVANAMAVATTSTEYLMNYASPVFATFKLINGEDPKYWETFINLISTLSSPWLWETKPPTSLIDLYMTMTMFERFNRRGVRYLVPNDPQIIKHTCCIFQVRVTDHNIKLPYVFTLRCYNYIKTIVIRDLSVWVPLFNDGQPIDIKSLPIEWTPQPGVGVMGGVYTREYEAEIQESLKSIRPEDYGFIPEYFH